MQTIDIIILLPLLYGAYKGYRRGFIIEIVSIAAFVNAVLIAFKFLNESTGFVAAGRDLQSRPQIKKDL